MFHILLFNFSREKFVFIESQRYENDADSDSPVTRMLEQIPF